MKYSYCYQCGIGIGNYTKTGLCLDCWHKYNRGENASNWRGGRTPYNVIFINGIQMPEHRYIWEQAYGKLPEGWVIHHLNGEKKDNRIENLMAMPRGRHWSDHSLATRLRNKQVTTIRHLVFNPSNF